MRSDTELRRLVDVVSLPTGQVSPLVEPYRSLTLLAPDHVEPRTGRILERVTAEEQDAISGKYAIRPGDVVLSKIRPYLRKAALVDFEGTCSADMYPLRASEEVDPRYLLATVLGEDFSRFAEAVSARTGIPKINRKELAEYSAYFPPLVEQRWIAEILDALDEQIAALNQVALKLSAVGESVVSNVLRDLVMDVGWTMLAEQFDVSAGIMLGPDRSPQDNPHGYLRVANVRRGVIDLDDVAELQASSGDFPRRALESGDLLVVEGHANPNEIGRCARVPVAAVGLLYQNHLFRLRSRSVISEFGELWLNSRYARNYWRRFCATSSGLNTINSKMLSEMRFPLCEADQQVQIIELAAHMNLAVHRVRSELVKLAALKSALMDDLLTGRVRMPAETLAEV